MPLNVNQISSGINWGNLGVAHGGYTHDTGPVTINFNAAGPDYLKPNIPQSITFKDAYDAAVWIDHRNNNSVNEPIGFAHVTSVNVDQKPAAAPAASATPIRYSWDRLG